MRIMRDINSAITGLAVGLGSSLLAAVIWSYMSAESARAIEESRMSLEATVKHLKDINAARDIDVLNLKHQVENYKIEGYMDIEKREAAKQKLVQDSAAYVRDEVSKIAPIALANSALGRHKFECTIRYESSCQPSYYINDRYAIGETISEMCRSQIYRLLTISRIYDLPREMQSSLTTLLVSPFDCGTMILTHELNKKSQLKQTLFYLLRSMLGLENIVGISGPDLLVGEFDRFIREALPLLRELDILATGQQGHEQ